MALEPHDFRHQATDIKTIMDELQVPDAHVVGISMGGVVAQFFALAFPNRIRSLTLVATLCVGTEVFSRRAEEVGGGDMSQLVEVTLRRWFTADAIAAHLPAVLYARECLWKFAPQSWKVYWRALARLDLIPYLSDISVPTQLVAGELDVSTTPQSMENMRRLIRGSQLHVVPGAPHLISLEQPHELAAVLANADVLASSTPSEAEFDE
jgi:3-oxoadipate enol-lactonase